MFPIEGVEPPGREFQGGYTQCLHLLANLFNDRCLAGVHRGH